MKNYADVYTASRSEVHKKRKNLYESQKIALVNVLKENYNITGMVSEQAPEVKQELARKLQQYWSPKTGINESGIEFLNTHQLVLTKESTTADVREYIRKMAVKNIVGMTECFRQNCTNVIVEELNNDIKRMMGRSVKGKFIIDTVWNVVSERIKTGK